MELDDPGVRQPGQRGRFVRQRVPLGLAGIGGLVPPAPPPVRRVRRHRLLPETLAGHAVRVAAEVHRPVGQVREDGRCGGDDVADEVSLRDRGAATTSARLAGGEQHLVEVGQPQGAALEHPLPAPGQLVQLGQLRLGDRDHVGERRPSGGDLGPVGGRVTAPQRLRHGSHVLVGAPALDRARMLLRVPAVDGVFVTLVEEQPLVLPRSGAGPCRPCARGRTGPPASRRRGRSGAHRPRPRPAVLLVLGRRPPATVPDDHVAAAVLAGRDDALEVGVVERVVLHMNGEVAGRQDRAWGPGDGPTHQHTAHLEPEVVVQPAGAVALHDEPADRSVRRRRAALIGPLSPDGSAVHAKSRLARYSSSGCLLTWPGGVDGPSCSSPLTAVALPSTGRPSNPGFSRRRPRGRASWPTPSCPRETARSPTARPDGRRCAGPRRQPATGRPAGSRAAPPRNQ